MPFTLRNLKEDLEDLGSNFDGAPDLEFRLATDALELEQSGLSYQRVPPGYRFPYGHSHKTQEEVYVVVRGSGRMKVDEEVVELKEWDAVRVPPGSWRGYEAGPEGLELLVNHLMKQPRGQPQGRHAILRERTTKICQRGHARRHEYKLRSVKQAAPDLESRSIKSKRRKL